MIIDDAADSCEPLMLYLKRLGHEVTCVPNGREALVAVIAKPPDVVVLDLVMPEMDGASFLEVVRSYSRLHALRVVVLTGLPDSLMVERARHLKVDAILLKAKATFEDIRKAVEQSADRPADA